MPLLQAMIAGLIALILTPGALFYFDVTPKLVVLLAGAAILLPLAAGRARPHRMFSALVLLYVVSLVASTLASSNPGLSWFGTNWRRYGAVAQISVLLFALTIAGTASRRAILRAVAIATVIASIYGMAQFAGIDPLLPRSAYRIGEGVWSIVRPPATFGYVSYFATWLAMAAFLGVALAAEERGRWRIFAIVSSGLAVVALLLTGTRAAMLGLAVGGAVWLYLRGVRPGRRALAICAMSAVAAAAFYVSPAGLQLRSRTRWFVEDPWGGARPALWRDSLAMGLSRPLLGFGPERFTAEFPRYESVELARAYPDFAHESPHNIFLDALVSQGLPGLALLAALLALGFRARNSALAAALGAGIVSQQFTGFTIPTALLTFTTLALTLPASDRPPVPVVRRWPAVALRTAALAFGIAWLYFAVRFTVADAALVGAQARVQSGDLRAADAFYLRYTRWKLPGAAADLWYSRVLFEAAGRTADPSLAIHAMARSGAVAYQATRSAEDPFNAWYNVAQMAAARNDSAGAETALRAAIAAHPNWFKPHWTLARLLELQGRREEAAAEAALALRLDAGKHEEVSRSLAELNLGVTFQR